MPAWISLQLKDGLIIKVAPGKLRSLPGAKPYPFYNGNEYFLNLIVMNNTNSPLKEELAYSWKLILREGKQICQNGEGTIRLFTKEHPFYRTWDKKNKVDFTKSDNRQYFTKYNAIQLRPLFEFDRYDLIIRAKEEEGIVCEFTLKDIDDYGTEHRHSLENLLIGAGISLVTALLTAFFVKGCSS